MTKTDARQQKSGNREVRPNHGFTFTRSIANIGGTGRCSVHFHFHSPYKDFLFYTPFRQSGLGMSGKEAVRIESRSDRWRFVCPRGHRDWEPTNHHFWCAACARRDDVDGVFYELHDRRDDRLLEREQVRLVTPYGPYDPEIDREGST